MEDRKLNEKESLELITRMIRETQENVARYAAYPLLAWGYTTVIVAIVIWYAFLQTGSYKVNYLWFALPAIAGPITLYFARKNGKRGVKNYIDRITGQIWLVFGVVGWVLSLVAFDGKVDILFIIPLLMGMATTLSGCVSKYKPMVIAGSASIALSFSILFIHGADRLLAFAAIFVVMMIIPGHILNKQMKQLCSKN